jgi:hypothetical protein
LDTDWKRTLILPRNKGATAFGGSSPHMPPSWAGIVGLDLLLPNIFTKMIIWMSVLAITFGFEAVLFEQLVERLTPVNSTVASAASAPVE